MAGFQATNSLLQALKQQLSLQMSSLMGKTVKVDLLSSDDLGKEPKDSLGIYLYRISVDPFSRNRYLPPKPDKKQPRPELPINIHVLLIGWSKSQEHEINLIAAAMQVIGSAVNIGISHIVNTEGWEDHEAVQMVPEEMSTEDLSRLWDTLASEYHLSAPYIIKTLRLSPVKDPVEEKPTEHLVFPMKVMEETLP